MNQNRKLNTSLQDLVSNLGSEREVSLLLDNQVISPLYGYRVVVQPEQPKNKTNFINLKVLNPENREYRISRNSQDFEFLFGLFQKEFPFVYVIL
jgi:hypothetical protein